MLIVKFKLDQGLYGEHTEGVIKDILIDAFSMYNSFNPNNISVMVYPDELKMNLLPDNTFEFSIVK